MRIAEWFRNLFNPPQPPPREPETLTKSVVFRRMKEWEEEADRAAFYGMHPVIIRNRLIRSQHYANLLEEMKMLNSETVVD